MFYLAFGVIFHNNEISRKQFCIFANILLVAFSNALEGLRVRVDGL